MKIFFIIAIFSIFSPIYGKSLKNKDLLSPLFQVQIGNRSIPVNQVIVGAGDPLRRFKAVDDLLHSEQYGDTAAFCYVSLKKKLTVSVICKQTIKKICVLPLNAEVKVIIKGSKCFFSLAPGQNLTVEVNGDIIHSLHVFGDPVRAFTPTASSANVIYFGPGTHYVTSIVVKSGQTVYLAAGAVVRAIIGKNEKYTTEPSGLRNYPPTFILNGRHIRFMGPGIIDASGCPVHSRSLLIVYRSKDVIIQDIILKNSSGWNLPIVQSDSVKVDNVKIMGYRANTDGVDINNSSHVTVSNCFVRTNDDLIVVKTYENQGEANHIIVDHCILWNQLADALSLGAELRENLSDVLFSNCSIIHDTGREWSLRVFQTDGAKIQNVRFEHIDIAETRQLISLWIGKAGPSFDKKLGEINNVSFTDINAIGTAPRVELTGADALHKINLVEFKDVYINTKKLTPSEIITNQFVSDLTVR